MKKSTKKRNIEKQDTQRKNIAAVKGTPAQLLIDSKLIQRMNSMSLEDIKAEMLEILNNATAITDKNRNGYIQKFERINDKMKMMMFVCDFELAAERLSTNLSNYSYR